MFFRLKRFVVFLKIKVSVSLTNYIQTLEWVAFAASAGVCGWWWWWCVV